jgi:hypothetical protein
MEKSKSQTAVELLTTYGWAILIILIVAGVLAYYGIFAPRGFLAQKTYAYEFKTETNSNPTLFCNKTDNETFKCAVRYCFEAGGFYTDTYCKEEQTNIDTTVIFRLVKP